MAWVPSGIPASRQNKHSECLLGDWANYLTPCPPEICLSNQLPSYMPDQIETTLQRCLWWDYFTLGIQPSSKVNTLHCSSCPSWHAAANAQPLPLISGCQAVVTTHTVATAQHRSAVKPTSQPSKCAACMAPDNEFRWASKPLRLNTASSSAVMSSDINKHCCGFEPLCFLDLGHVILYYTIYYAASCSLTGCKITRRHLGYRQRCVPVPNYYHSISTVYL